MNNNRANITLAGESNTGLTRSHNEDNFLVYAPPGGEAVLAAVADGIGGHGKGENASYICCRELFAAAGRTESSRWDEKFLFDTLNEANRKIFERNFAERRTKPMGCTVVAAIFFRDRIIFANAGDSRLYEYDPDGAAHFSQLSVDHRPRRREGIGLKDEFSNFVCRSLGPQFQVEFELQTRPRPPQARYLLCSDGLYSQLPDSQLAGVLGSDMSIRAMTGKLMCDALLAGTRDNITLICAGNQTPEA